MLTSGEGSDHEVLFLQAKDQLWECPLGEKQRIHGGSLLLEERRDS
jgi:hypothetical protein